MLPLLPIFIFRPRVNVPYSDLIDYTIDQHLNHTYDQHGHSFALQDTRNQDFDGLYNVFLDHCYDLFPSLELKPNNSRQAWAYVSNCDDYRSNIHNHSRTCTINGVFYLNVPRNRDYRDSSISFYDAEKSEIFTYKPVTGDLIIFPHYLLHNPNPNSSPEYRIAINMEVQSNDVWANK